MKYKAQLEKDGEIIAQISSYSLEGLEEQLHKLEKKRNEMEFEELEENREQAGRLKALIELKEKLKDESVLREVILDSGATFSGNLINIHSLMRIIDKMIEEV